MYGLVRHVAVGWGIVEEALGKERERQRGAGGNLPKRVRRLLARRKRDHIPGERDVDGVATGIVRLHDYYKFNASSFVEEGVFETEEWRAETTGELTVWDAFKIGVKGTNNMFLGSGIEIMARALDKAKAEGVVSTPPFIDALDVKVLKNLIKTAKTVHDQKLDRWGPRTPNHSTNQVGTEETGYTVKGGPTRLSFVDEKLGNLPLLPSSCAPYARFPPAQAGLGRLSNMLEIDK